MLQSSYSRPYNPYRQISVNNPEPVHSRATLDKEFNLVEKLSNHNNQLLEQIRQLSRKNQELNQAIDSKLMMRNTKPQKYVRTSMSPNDKMSNQVYQTYTQPKGPKNYEDSRLQRQSRNKSANRFSYLKEHQRDVSFSDKKRDSSASRRRIFTKPDEPQYIRSRYQNTYGEELGKYFRNTQKFQEEEVDAQQQNIEIPLSNNHRSHKDLAKRQPEGVYPIRNSRPRKHPSTQGYVSRHKQGITLTKNSYMNSNNKQNSRQEDRDWKKTNQPYLAILTQSNHHPSIYIPNKEAIPTPKTRSPKKSHIVYTHPTKISYC